MGQNGMGGGFGPMPRGGVTPGAMTAFDQGNLSIGQLQQLQNAGGVNAGQQQPLFGSGLGDALKSQGVVDQNQPWMQYRFPQGGGYAPESYAPMQGYGGSGVANQMWRSPWSSGGGNPGMGGK